MNMVTCDRCSKLFGSPGPRICPACSKELDAIYKRAREYLRDHDRERLNVRELAEAIGEEAADLDLLVSMGRLRLFDEDDGVTGSGDREKLLQDFQKSLNKGKGSQKGQSSSLYVAERYRKKD